jgi:hypothetical protein
MSQEKGMAPFAPLRYNRAPFAIDSLFVGVMGGSDVL